MHRVAISSTGLFTPPDVITNAELVASYNAYAALQNAQFADERFQGITMAMPKANVVVVSSNATDLQQLPQKLQNKLIFSA